MISVCMATYNGERYIEKQLESILEQSLKADEVVICDDHSGDHTVERIKNFLEAHSLTDTWRLYCNEKNKGYPGNFYAAMSLCRGDLVFLADQDDIWAADKLEVMSRVLAKQPQGKVICCRFGLIDGAGRPISSGMNPSRSGRREALRNVTLADVFYKTEWPGMVMAYRREWFLQKQQEWAQEGQKEFYPVGIPHDFLLCAWAAEEGGFLQINQELAWHRRHDSNEGQEEHRIRRLINKERKLWEIRKYRGILDSFQREGILTTSEGQRILQSKQKAMQQRYEALESGKVTQVLKSAWNNRRLVRLSTVMCDLAIAMGMEAIFK